MSGVDVAFQDVPTPLVCLLVGHSLVESGQAQNRTASYFPIPSDEGSCGDERSDTLLTPLQFHLKQFFLSLSWAIHRFRFGHVSSLVPLVEAPAGCVPQAETHNKMSHGQVVQAPASTAAIPLSRVATQQAAPGAAPPSNGGSPSDGSMNPRRTQSFRRPSQRLWLLGDVIYSTVFAAWEASELSMREMLQGSDEERDRLTLTWRKEKQSELKYVGLTVSNEARWPDLRANV